MLPMSFVSGLLQVDGMPVGGLVEAYLGVEGGGKTPTGLRVDFEWYAIRKRSSGDFEELPAQLILPDVLEAPVHSARYFEDCKFQQANDYAYITNGIQGNSHECYTKDFLSWKVSNPSEAVLIAIKLLGITNAEGKVVEDSDLSNLSIQIRLYDPYSTNIQNWTRLFFCIIIGVGLYFYQRSLDQSGSRQRLSFQLFIKYVSLLGIIGHLPLLTARPSSSVYLIFASCLLSALFQSYFNTVFLIMTETVARDLGFQPANKNTAVKKLYFLCTFVFFAGFRITFYDEWGKPTSERRSDWFSLHRLFALGNFSIGVFTTIFVVVNVIRSWRRWGDLDARSKGYLLPVSAFAPSYLLGLLIPAQVYHRILDIQVLRMICVAIYILALGWLFAGSSHITGQKVNDSSIASSRGGQSRPGSTQDRNSKNTDQYDPGQPNSTEEHSFNPRKVEDTIDSSSYDPEQFDPNLQKPKKTASNPNSLDDGAEARYGSSNKSTHVSPTKHPEQMFGTQAFTTPKIEVAAQEEQEEPNEISYDMENEDIS